MDFSHEARTEVSEGNCSVTVLEDERSVWVTCKVDGDWVIRTTAPRRDDALRAAQGAARLLKELIEERAGGRT
jgi:hypothetical protein